ncbi:MAG: hypothetical protein QM647_16175 [Asticcacaulis sp.]|uniref:hypothetical protein n=1 Tax=Asticcacaulis sp. TaxID=1872648 RepID=UPI0039E6DECE
MSLNSDLMFEKADITQDLIARLGLPRNVWSLVIDEALENAYFMDTNYEIHQQSIHPDVRPVVERAVKGKTPPARSERLYRHYA